MMLEQESEAEPNTDIVGLAPCWERQNNAPFKTPIPLIIFAIPIVNRSRAVRYDAEK